MSAPRVVAVSSESPAADAGIYPGDEILSINGVVPRDVIEYQMLVDEPAVDLELRRAHETVSVSVAKSAGDSLGAEVSSAVFDRVRTCDNHCEFCFIYQLPKGMRKSLYMKDDDYRLSFLYGNFTTLTRFTEADLERVVSEGLSPLYVSIHATDPEVRARLLKNERGAMSLRWLAALLEAKIEVHGQIVLCPGVNDGEILENTLTGILDEYPTLASVGIVPLGVSRYTKEGAMRPHTADELNRVIDSVEAAQQMFQQALGKRMVFLSDEYYVAASKPIPDSNHYENFAQHENGIGISRQFIDSFHDAGVANRAAHSGFFQWVDGAPATGYRAHRCGANNATKQLSLRRKPKKIVVATGDLGAKVLNSLEDEIAELASCPVEVRPIANDFFGGNIGVAGLMCGSDVRNAISDLGSDTAVLLPDVCLSNGKFLDDVSIEDLPENVQVVPTNGAALRQALKDCYV